MLHLSGGANHLEIQAWALWSLLDPKPPFVFGHEAQGLEGVRTFGIILQRVPVDGESAENLLGDSAMVGSPLAGVNTAACLTRRV